MERMKRIVKADGRNDSRLQVTKIPLKLFPKEITEATSKNSNSQGIPRTNPNTRPWIEENL